MKRTAWVTLGSLMVVAVVAAGSAAAAPRIKVGLQEGAWLEEVTVGSQGGGVTLYLQLSASTEGGGPPHGHGHGHGGGGGGDEEETYQFDGPGSTSDYQLTYFMEDEQVENSFDVDLVPGESVTVRVDVQPIGAPDRYLFAVFALTDEDGDAAYAGANLVVPGDLMVRAPGQETWHGEDFFAEQTAPWDAEEMPTAVAGSAVEYQVKLDNVENAYVSYTFHAVRQDESAVIARYYAEGQEITPAITSSQGFASPVLGPGEEFTITASLTPVGSESTPRQVAVTANVADVAGPQLDLGAVINGLSPFTIHEDSVPDQVGQTFLVYEHSHFTPGCFGLLNLDGGSPNTPELWDWILNGYDGFSVPKDPGYIWVTGSPGWRSTLVHTMQEMVDAEARMTGLVFDEAQGQGSNSEVRGIGVVEYTPIACDNHFVEARLESFTVMQAMMVSAFDAVNFGVGARGGLTLERWREVD